MASTLTSPSFADLIMHHARVRPEKPAIILADRVVTYDMMAQGILWSESRLRSLGLSPGSLVGIAIQNPIRHMILAAALYRLGHPSISVRQIADVLPLRLPIEAFLHAEGESVHLGQKQFFIGDEWFAGERQPIPVNRSTGFENDDIICRVELSSGTTGRPKAVSLTAGALFQWCINFYPAFGLGEWDRMLSRPGLTSSWGFSLAAHAFFAGRTMVFAATARDCLQMIAVYGVDALVASPHQLREMMREQAEAPIACPTLRLVVAGGSTVPQSLMQEVRAKLCNAMMVSYGSTEAGVSAYSSVERLTSTQGASGYVAPWADIEIVDENDNRLEPDIEGIVRIRANCQAEPFPPDRPDGHRGFRNGWFYPGDRGLLTTDGLLVLTGRTSDVINVGGVKISSELIQETVLKHPAVVEAVAIGGGAPDGLEQIVLILVTRQSVSENAIINWCSERGIPVASAIVVEELPKTDSGKINKQLIIQQFGTRPEEAR